MKLKLLGGSQNFPDFFEKLKKKILGFKHFFGEIPNIFEKEIWVPKKKRGYIQLTKEFPFKEIFKRKSFKNINIYQKTF